MKKQPANEDISFMNEPELSTELFQALHRLDRILSQAVAIVGDALGPNAADDPFRGLHLSPEEMAMLLERKPGAPLLWSEPEGGDHQADIDALGNSDSRLGWLKQTFGLSPFEMDVLLVALAAELDLRYERLYAYLQDDVSKRRPTIDLALNLLCSSAEMKLACRESFTADAPLIRNRLLYLIPDPNLSQLPLLAHALKLDEQIVRLLLGQQGLDTRLADFTEIVQAECGVDGLLIDPSLAQGLLELFGQARAAQQCLQVYFGGPHGVGKRRAAAAVADELGVPLLAADLGRVIPTSADVELALTLLFREAWFRDAILYLDGVDTWWSDERNYRLLEDTLSTDGGITILAGTSPWRPTGRRALDVLGIPFTMPAVSHRRAQWQIDLTTQGFSVDAHEIDSLAARYRLTPAQISAAVSNAAQQMKLDKATRSAEEASLSKHSILRGLISAARAQSGQNLATLAQKIEPKYTWRDIVLPEDTLVQLHEICQRVVHRHRVFDEGGFERKLSLGRGVNALFAGPSGAGKTMAAEVIANELQLDLYKIDLSGVVSKYIGETEKNLDRIFTAAENANAILLFDEADALFGKRTEVRDSHDRYANIETCYLLQKMEQFDGVALLATNQRQNLDPAFIRRLAFTVHFPFPDEASRQQIWMGIWPTETSLSNDVDLEFLARQHKLSGGNIKNIALASAFLAAEEDKPVSMSHLLQAVRREFQKMGKALSETELQPVDKRVEQGARSAA